MKKKGDVMGSFAVSQGFHQTAGGTTEVGKGATSKENKARPGQQREKIGIVGCSQKEITTKTPFSKTKNHQKSRCSWKK
ncbi:hypothetical protein [Acanthopleuribacter pedis]|uniref:Uncharacterized protein n=1 Tax=Acanthopleuribacter pedis TaxID=442870 RepID=A0A8J7U4U3_9BACT|nr:hypothetical protein [Acanthopleuribacter pedis]MBO1319813.1 hypothetical protein [Acanthopleuribacter pedis]